MPAQGTCSRAGSTRAGSHIASSYKVLTGCAQTEAGTAVMSSTQPPSAPAHLRDTAKVSSLQAPSPHCPACHQCQVGWMALLRSQGGDRVAPAGSAGLISLPPSAHLHDAKTQHCSWFGLEKLLLLLLYFTTDTTKKQGSLPPPPAPPLPWRREQVQESFTKKSSP